MMVVKCHHHVILLFLLPARSARVGAFWRYTHLATSRKVDDGFADNDYGDDDEDRAMTVYDDDDRQRKTSAPLPINI